MIIAFEGVDNCGKTTIINKLQREFEFDSIKFPSPEGLFYSELKAMISTGKQKSQQQKQLYFILNILSKLDYLKEYRFSADKHILLDRFLYSTIAYGEGKFQQDLFIPYKSFIEDTLQVFSPDYLIYIRKPRVYDISNKKRANATAYDKDLYIQERARRNYEQMINSVMKYSDTLILEYIYNSPDVMYYKVKEFLVTQSMLKNVLQKRNDK